MITSSDVRPRPTRIELWCQVARLLGYAAIAGAALVLAYRSYLYCSYVTQAIRYPFGLDYGEGIVWQQALLIPGRAMYGDINHYPFIVFHYPPLYHLVTRLAVALGLDWLTAGRTVSVLSTLVSVFICCVLIYQTGREVLGRLPSFVGGAIGASIILTHYPVLVWSPLMRVDMLAIAFGFVGLLLCERSFDQPKYLYAAVIAFTAAVYTRQTALAAPIAGIGPFLVLQPRRALLAVLFGLVFSAGMLAGLSWYTDGRFLQHIVGYNINRFDLRIAYWSTLSLMRRNTLYLLVAFAGAAAAICRTLFELRMRNLGGMAPLLRNSRLAWMTLTFLTYFAVSTAMLASLGKSGADTNYTIEWLCTLSLFIGLAVSFAIYCMTRTEASLFGLLTPLGPILIVLALVQQVRALPLPDESKFHNTAEQRELKQLVRWIHVASKPVLSDDMVLLMVAGKQVPLEPAIFAELSATGHWDERREIDLVKSGFFQFIITEGNRGSHEFDSRYVPAVADAIETAYPRKVDFAGYKIRLPKDSDCDAGPPLRCPPDIIRR